MKEISIFTNEEKETAKALYKAYKAGDNESFIKYYRMRLASYSEALEEYKKHPKNESVTTDFPDDDDFLQLTVGDLINECTTEIERMHRYLFMHEK